MSEQSRGRLVRGGVYAITPEIAPGTGWSEATVLTATQAALAAGIGMLQYRAKPPQLEFAKSLMALCKAHNVPFVVNDDLQLAHQLKCGVHLGEFDGDVAKARALLGADAIVGASCYDDLQRAQSAKDAGASYVALGAMFPTQSKANTRHASLELLSESLVLNIPVIAIGGIDGSNATLVLKAGAKWIAAINGVFADGSPESISGHVQALKACFGQAKPIRSFVLRQGRLTGGQDRAMQELLPRFTAATDAHTSIDTAQLFGNPQPTVLEIGFGNGDALVACAGAEPSLNFIGAEVHAPGVGRALLGIERERLSNVRIAHGDVVPLLRNQLPDQSLARIHIWFPDPWHKARHHKRRLIQPDFVRLLARKLSIGGILHLATDWENYAEHMHEVLQHSGLRNLSPNGNWCEKPSWRPETHFERRGVRLGHGVWDLLWQRD